MGGGCGCGRGGREGVEFQEEELRFGEEGAGVCVARGGAGGFQLGEDLLELLVGHLGLDGSFFRGDWSSALGCLGLDGRRGCERVRGKELKLAGLFVYCAL